MIASRLGTVASYDVATGFGFVSPHEGGTDATFGRDDCDREPQRGSLVSFATGARAGRPIAEHIKVLR